MKLIKKENFIMYYIYKIENLVNHKKYIGLTNNIERRRSRHFSDLRNGRHDNSFLQKEYNIYGEENFNFNVEFEGDISSEEIGDKEKEFIKKYDSYRNGYNQNEGGNFGPSNGGSHLTQIDIFNILSALEFCSKPGQILSDIFGVSKTTISRIKKGVNHNQ
jgi:group I intron endonuclease